MLDKKIVMIDMDGVLVDLQSEIDNWFANNPDPNPEYIQHPDHIPGIFKNPKPIPGAVEAVKKLYDSGKYDLLIATTAPWGNPDSNTDKRLWISKHFGNIFDKKMIITHRKDLLCGDYLIDDRVSNGAGNFRGMLLSFGYNYETGKWNQYLSWKQILRKLL